MSSGFNFYVFVTISHGFLLLTYDVYVRCKGFVLFCLLPVIHPAIMETSLKPFISNGLSDLSVSRNRSRLQWGIPVPGDETQTASCNTNAKLAISH